MITQAMASGEAAILPRRSQGAIGDPVGPTILRALGDPIVP
jgi:hypothetical protein